MNALLEVLPRRAGNRIVEPSVGFDEVEQAAHAADRCPVSCVCAGSATTNCVATGHTRL